MKGKKLFRKICKYCGEEFTPTSKGDTLCLKCFYKARHFGRKDVYKCLQS